MLGNYYAGAFSYYWDERSRVMNIILEDYDAEQQACHSKIKPCISLEIHGFCLFTCKNSLKPGEEPLQQSSADAKDHDGSWERDERRQACEQMPLGQQHADELGYGSAYQRVACIKEKALPGKFGAGLVVKQVKGEPESKAGKGVYQKGKPPGLAPCREQRRKSVENAAKYVHAKTCASDPFGLL